MSVRLISATSSQMLAMGREELVGSIAASEGRVICSENICSVPQLVPGLTNAEVAASTGADLILLNMIDVLNPVINGLPDVVDGVAPDASPVAKLRAMVGRPVGANLEPVDQGAEMAEDRLSLPAGRQASAETLRAAAALGLDFICLTGNPATGVTSDSIAKAVATARAEFRGMIIAGKMHGAGVRGSLAAEIFDDGYLLGLIEAGADVVLLPAVGTVPGIGLDAFAAAVDFVHANGALVMSAVGTSQESSTPEVIRQFGLWAKMAGVDIQHMGDGSAGFVSPPLNLIELSRTIRGDRHTITRMASSIRR